MFEDASQLIPHWIEESIELFWSVYLDMRDVFGWVGDIEPLRLR